MKINKTDDVIKLVKKCGKALVDNVTQSCDKGLILDMVVELIREIEGSAEENIGKTSAELFEDIGYKRMKSEGEISFWKREKNSDIYPHFVDYINIFPDVVSKCGCMVYTGGKRSEIIDKTICHEEIIAIANYIEELR